LAHSLPRPFSQVIRAGIITATTLGITITTVGITITTGIVGGTMVTVIAAGGKQARSQGALASVSAPRLF
jgi:hypothetical protein